MIVKMEIVPNETRTARTKSALIEAGRALFLEKGFADTGTPEIVKRAQVTRGALYHHYKDKKDLFRAVLTEEIRAVAEQIEEQSDVAIDPLQALKEGADAFIQSMATKGRTRLILIEGPAVLGRNEILKIEDQFTRKTLVAGLEEAMSARAMQPLPLAALTETLSAMFDAAALNVDSGLDAEDIKHVVHKLIDGLAV